MPRAKLCKFCQLDDCAEFELEYVANRATLREIHSRVKDRGISWQMVRHHFRSHVNRDYDSIRATLMLNRVRKLVDIAMQAMLNAGAQAKERDATKLKSLIDIEAQLRKEKFAIEQEARYTRKDVEKLISYLLEGEDEAFKRKVLSKLEKYKKL